MPVPFTPAWLANEPAAQGFLPLDFRLAPDRLVAIAAARAHVMPAGLVDVIAAQQARLPACPARDEAVAQLRDPEAMAVVTGQQVGLFLGPLYTLYKAASTLRLARDLAKQTGLPCVPIFWLQTEDHDFEEIRRVHLPDAAGPLALELADCQDNLRAEAAGPLVPIRARRLGGQIADLHGLLDEHLAPLPSGGEVTALLERHYRADATLAAAFAGVLAELFAGQGLVILDPSDSALVPFAAPLHRRAFADSEAIAAALSERSDALQKAGFTAQVHVRPHSPLSFWHRGGRDGPRFRLAPAATDTWRLCGSQDRVRPADIADDLLQRPERFSTSALLRPLLQDSWLPTVAYVGGPGECAYFAQLAPLYAAFGRQMPLVVPRARFALVDAPARRLAARLGLRPQDAPRSEAALLALLGAKGALAVDADRAPAPDDLAQSMTGPLRQQLARLAADADSWDPGLAKAARRLEGSTSRQIGKFVARYLRALGGRDETTRGRLARLQGLLAPGGVAQERRYGFATFAARAGASQMLNHLIAHAEPWQHELVWLDI